MATSDSEGTQTAVISTEHTLATISTAGVYVLTVDLNAMANSDITTIRAKIKVRSTGTTRLVQLGTYANIQQGVITSDPITVITEGVFTLEQTAGTGRAYPWEVIKL